VDGGKEAGDKDNSGTSGEMNQVDLHNESSVVAKVVTFGLLGCFKIKKRNKNKAMNHSNRFLPMFFFAALMLNSCRTSTGPNSGTPVGMRATINGTPWVADTALVVQSGTCLVLMGWTGSGTNTTSISLSLSSSLTAPDSCAPNVDYIKKGERISELMGQHGTLFLAGRTSSNLQGTFAFRGVAFRSTDSTLITNGEFNLNIKN
jgi:hypothetical protein